MQTLTGKIIVIIGGTSGIGLSAASAFVARGAMVVAVGRDDEHVENAKRLLGETAFVFPGEATDSTTAPRAIREAQQRFGGFHGLYHVAGGSGRKLGDGPLHELTDAGLEATMLLNFHSVVYSNRAAVQAFMAQGASGSILNLGSVLGFSPSPRYFSTHAYAAAKAAIIGFTRTVAAHYAPYNLRVNVLAPALVTTPMSRRATSDERILSYIKTKQPLDAGRIGAPQDLDEAAVYFMSEASRFVTGQVLAIDGGWTVSEGQFAQGGA